MSCTYIFQLLESGFELNRKFRTKPRRADTFSESDPYLAAFWDGQPLGESPVVYDCGDPKWSECLFHFPILDFSKAQGKTGKDGRGALRRSMNAPRSVQPEPAAK